MSKTIGEIAWDSLVGQAMDASGAYECYVASWVDGTLHARDRIAELERWQITECPFHKIPLISWNGEFRYCPHSNCHWPEQYPKTIAKAQEGGGG
jgi:hypothetical protein